MRRQTTSTFIVGPYRVTLRACSDLEHLYELIVSDDDRFPSVQFVGTAEEAQQRFEEKKLEVVREVARLALGI